MTPNDNAQKVGWQPIETAPKDGTVVLVPLLRWDGRVEVVTTHWNRDWVGADKPNHWMPLPEPPNAD